MKKLTVEYYIPAIDRTYQKTLCVPQEESMLEAAKEAVRQHLKAAAVFASAVVVSLSYKTGRMTSRLEVNEVVLQEEEFLV